MRNARQTSHFLSIHKPHKNKFQIQRQCITYILYIMEFQFIVNV